MARSQPKSRRGGRGSVGAFTPTNQTTVNVRTQPVQPTPQQAPPPQPPQPQPTPPQPQPDDTEEESGAGLREFQNMTSQQQAQEILNAISSRPPAFLPDNSLQRFIYNIGGDGMPKVVSDSQLNSMQGRDMFRQVAGVKNNLGMQYKSKDIADQVMYGEHTLYSDSGGSAYGRALYFADNVSDVMWYGTGHDSTLFRGKITGGKGISNNTLDNQVAREIRSGSALGKALTRCDSASRGAIYALAKGYSYSYDGTYYMVYDRGCMTFSTTTKHNNTSRTW